MFHEEIALHDIINEYFLKSNFNCFYVISPRNIFIHFHFIDGVFSITFFPIFNVGNLKGILSLIEYL